MPLRWALSRECAQGRGISVRIVTNLRNRLADYLEPIDQDKRMAVDFSTRRAVVTPRVAMAACIVIVVLALGAIAAVVWPSSPQVEMPAVQDAAAVGTTPETTETSAETPGGPGKETNAQAQAGPLIVSVVGLVVNPGVVEVPAGARVVEAIERAGGLLPEANPASVNLAAPLVDGQQIVVGTEALPAGEIAGGSGGADGSGADSADSGAAGASEPSGQININTATATQLEELPGIGPATATKIIDFREKNGPFASIDALEEVPGIGPAKVEALRDVATI
ncbi:ComEA family DNA-binding protein [Corynebacterium amycolatum]|uniref:ComEA family DNA-binding protein n=1 Tax=Corynebacterium amycolatum TaxID=43765 RepID=A0AB37GDX4_CORAY|nr:ComEA family DNA-binding protein [Corynebacterium amycolatum]QQB83907.1 ComEA family DNA-binding protein [Corynebacterium amycolatum]QQV01107.1 ComEA family DNA-binding protein [Corynebacterium amycolatum]